MKANKAKDESTKQDRSLPTEETPLECGGETSVGHDRKPPRASPGRKIHPRRETPPVPEGDEVEDSKPSPPAKIDSST